MSKYPLVSIITPSYNQGIFIEDTLLSVMNQNYPNIEHIVIDGGSTDNTISLLKHYETKYNLKWTSKKDKGQTDAVNKGFTAAKGDIIGWVNSDDVYYDKFVINKIINFFNDYPNVDIAYGKGIFIDKYGYILGIYNSIPWFDFNRLRRTQFFFQPSTFFRADVIKNNKLDLNYNFSMDHEFYLRLASNKIRFKYFEDIVSAYRVHDKTKTSGKSKELKDEFRNLKVEYGVKYDLNYYISVLMDKIILSYFTFICIKQMNKLYSDKEKENLAFKAKLYPYNKSIINQIKLCLPYQF